MLIVNVYQHETKKLLETHYVCCCEKSEAYFNGDIDNLMKNDKLIGDYKHVINNDGNNLIIAINGKPAGYFNYCQFCGEKVRFITKFVKRNGHE